MASKSDEKLTNSDSPATTESENIYKSVCHTCHYDEESRKRDARRLIVASIVCVMFMVAEIIGGILSNSLAIASDAAHLLSDLGSFLVSLAAIWISSKPQTKEMSFGFHRAEVIGALISVLLIWVITGILVYLAVLRVINEDYELDALIMIYVSVGGILANIVMGIALTLYKSGSKKERSKEQRTLNIKSAFIHIIGDLIQSIGVFIASLVIYFKPEYKIADPICTFVFSVIVLGTTFQIMKDIIRVLMEGFPKHLDFFEVQNVLFSIPGIKKIHNLRLWSLTTDKVALSAHIVVQKGENYSSILKNASDTISRNFNIFEITLQVEEMGDPVTICANCV